MPQELHELKIWILTGAVTILLGLVAWAGKSFISAILKKMDTVIAELRNLSLSSVQLASKVDRHGECLEDHKGQLQEHDRRITRLERTTPTSTHSSEL